MRYNSQKEVVMEKFVIIDGTNLIFRAFYALPLLTNFEGEVSNAVFGFTNMIVKIIKEINPRYIAVALDADKKTFRHKMYKEYKGNRTEMPSELRCQFPILKGLLNAMNITYVEKSGLEADDLIGCLSRAYETENIVVTADRDCYQLINENTVVMQPKKGITETVIYDLKQLEEEWGLKPEQIIDYKALRGDPSDNIPGVKGVGDKTAIELLKTYGSLEKVYDNLVNIKGKLQDKLRDGKEDAYLSKELATIVTSENLNYKLDEFVYDFPFNSEVLNYFKRYQFNSLLKKADLFKVDELNNAQSSTQKLSQFKQVNVTSMQELNELSNIANNQTEIAVYFDNNLFSVAFADKEYNVNFGGDLFQIGFAPEDVLKAFKDVFENEKVKKVIFDSKIFKHVLLKHQIELRNVVFDVVVGRYIINTGGKANVTLQNVLDENLLTGDNSSANLFLLRDIFLERIKQQGLEKIFYEIEMPLIDVLFDMEIQGFKIDIEQLDLLENKYEAEIKEITEKVYEMVGIKFNINSPKQLGEVLFDKLKLNSFNNKKKSTSVQILNELVGQHPVVDLIIRYRHISKLYTTYIVAFKDLINRKNNKIYTIFNQTSTTTGRLSSSEPNLQNIPVRTEEGRGIRKMFVPTHNEGYIVGADYSQIELRLLAGLSGDDRMINAFNENVDIHALTASEIFGVSLSEVTPEQRRNAKAINFGIIYGMSDYGLSQTINSSVPQANDYIKRYFSRYPKIETYMQNNVEFCKQNGFVRTMFGRIRHIPEIKSNNHNLKLFGERAAMNMPLQGSASDIIKLSMIKVYNEFKKRQLKSKLILQVHDELLVDTAPDELEIVKSILKDCMENVVELPVKLEVNIEHGKNWFEAK